MNPQQNLFPEHHEYFLLIEPDAATKKTVKDFKQLMHTMTPLSKKNLESVPHITLFEYVSTENQDDFVKQKAETILLETEVFNIQLGGVETLKHGTVSRSVVLKVDNQDPLKHLYKKLSTAFSLKKKAFYAHLTVARDLPVASYNQIGSLEAFDYKSSFPCKGITILKKGWTGTYQPLHQVKLKG